MADHPRFREAKLGIIVSSVRALQLFLRKNSKLDRLPDYIIVEGPLAGGHLGFGMDWAEYDLHTIMDEELLAYMKAEQLDIPLIAAGGIFTGSDAVGFLEKGAAACRWRPASPSPTSAACRPTSSRSTTRPAKKTSSSTASRRPATRCAC
jgi:hypothetical protein